MRKLSFIIPVYKPRGDYFRKCLDSLKHQSLKDIEVICVFDGQDDEAWRVASNALKDIDHKLINIDHAGACAARNKGFEESRGEYVVFWDCDCIIEPGAAEQWVEDLDSGRGDFVYSGYSFAGEAGAVESQPFDPWSLKIRNYISSCFPVRRSFVGKWDESLESLQDWDFWLQVVEKGGVGFYRRGYAFTTAPPDNESISGKGCTPEVWLSRVKKVKAKHGLKDRDVCVTSIDYREDAVHLAKMIDADYQDFPNHKPHEYKTIVQVGFSLEPNRVQLHTKIFSGRDYKKVIFWTADDILRIYNGLSYKALYGDRYSKGYVELLNAQAKQLVEDKEAKWLLSRVGFKVDILPMPMSGEVLPFPEKPKWAVDCQDEYGYVMNMVNMSLPDIEIEPINGTRSLEDYTGLIHFYQDRTLSNSIKRMAVAGRPVISNVQAPLAGYLDDRANPETFIPDMVNKVRELTKAGQDKAIRGDVMKRWGREKFLEVLG